MKSFPSHIPAPKYLPEILYKATTLTNFAKTHHQLNRMREACSSARRVLDKVIGAVKPGISTNQLDEVAKEECIKLGVYPSPLGYHGFPAYICTSVNDTVCHGIPNDRVLEEGDIVNVDVTVFKEGMHGDCSETVVVGRDVHSMTGFVKAAKSAMEIGIDQIKPGKRVRAIGLAIEKFASHVSLGLVRKYVGHGIGEHFHMAPQIPHWFQKSARTRMVPGMTFTVEPMLNVMGPETRLLDDNWTVKTLDGSWSAQFEHTILVTRRGYEILTV